MCIDSDIKIAGDKPSQNIKSGGEVFSPHKIDPAEKEKAMLVGREVADSFAEDAASSDIGDIENTSEELVMQRRLLLSFTATAGPRTLQIVFGHGSLFVLLPCISQGLRG